MTLRDTSFCQDISRYFSRERQIWRGSFTFSSPSPSRLFLADESGCFQNKFLTVYQKIPVPQWWACSVLSFHCVCVCLCVCVLLRKSLLQLQGMKTGDKWIPCLQENMLEAQENFVVYEEHVKPIKSELSSCCCSFCRLQFSVRSPAVSPPSEQVCVCAGKVERHTCGELACTQKLAHALGVFTVLVKSV